MVLRFQAAALCGRYGNGDRLCDCTHRHQLGVREPAPRPGAGPAGAALRLARHCLRGRLAVEMNPNLLLRAFLRQRLVASLSVVYGGELLEFQGTVPNRHVPGDI